MKSSITSLIRNAVRAGPQARKGDGTSGYYRCPLCRKDKRLEVHYARQVWHCHKCGLGGSLTGGKMTEAMTREVERQFFTSSVDGDFLRHYVQAGRRSPQWRYLSRIRKIPTRRILDLRPHQGPEPLRVYFPLYQLGEDIPCYYIGRSIIRSNMISPYMCPPVNCTRYRKSELLWGLHRIRLPVHELVLCEGILDAVWGDNRLAILGKSLGGEQTKTIVKRIKPTSVTFMLDGDAHEAAMTAANKLADFYHGPIHVVQLPSGSDPDSLRDVSQWMKKWKMRVA